MTDFSKKSYGSAQLGALQGDIERGLTSIRGDLDGLQASGVAYTPARPADWAGTAPTTQQEATDRIAYHIASGGGGAPILELP